MTLLQGGLLNPGAFCCLYITTSICFICAECYFQFSNFFEVLFPYWYISVNPQLSFLAPPADLVLPFFPPYISSEISREAWSSDCFNS